MSVQLILYPQSFNGLNSLSGAGTEHVVDGINFNTLNTSTTALSLAIPTYQSAINALYATMIVNTWYRFSLDTNPPNYASGNAQILVRQGIMQKLSNLIVGQLYDVEIITSVATNLNFYVYSGTSQQSVTPVSTVGANNFQFTATSTNNVIILHSTGVSFCKSISIRQAAQNPSGAIQDLATGQVICDLYEDEDIPLTLSIDDFKNVAEQVQSYSKAFNLPATKRNNQIFDNIFEVTRDTSGLAFNPYVRTQCELKQDGFILFQGYLRLIEIQEKQGEISYNVNLYSEAIALADFLEDRTFKDLDFSELTHQYTYTQIRNSWEGILGLTSPLPVGTFAGTAGASTTGVLRYPFVDWNHSFSYDPSTGFPVLPNLESAFRPFISIKYIIQNIFAASPFSYTSNFIDNDADFQKLFMDFNWGNAQSPTVSNINNYWGQWAFQISGSTASVYAGTTFTNLVLENIGSNSVPPNYNLSTDIITATANGEQYNISGGYRIENTSVGATQTVECQWIKNTSVVFTQTLTISPSSYQDFNFNITQTLLTGETLQAQFKRSNPLSANTVRMYESGTASTSSVIFNVNTVAITSNILLQTLRSELGQWQFLKGIMTMFNLVSVPDKNNPNNIIIAVSYTHLTLPTIYSV